MPYCARCGVEVDSGEQSCPLCSAEIPTFVDDVPAPAEEEVESPRVSRYPEVPGRTEPMTSWQIRMTVWASLSAVFIVSFLVALAVNLVWTGGQITWSGYAMASIGLAFGLGTTICFFLRRLWLIVLTNYPILVGFLAVLDILDGSLDWFLFLGLPIASACVLAAMASVIVWTFWRDRGANQLAILFGNVALLCLGVDLIISANLGSPSLSWSFIIVAVLVPLAGFFFIYHYVLRRFLKLERIFHM